MVNDLPVLDPQPLRDLLEIGAEPELIQELIDLLREDVPMRLAALRAALTTGDMPQILNESHQLKGALGNLGLMRFAELASRIETEARTGQLDHTPAIIETLPAAYDEALGAITRAFPVA